MNLGRAKTILIIAFIGLNFFLGYHLFWSEFGHMTTVAVTSDDLQETIKYLNDHNYFLEVPLDRSVKVSDFLTVTPAVGFQGDILQLFIKNGAKKVEAYNGTAYQANDMTAYVHPGGLTRIVLEPGIVFGDNGSGQGEQQLKNKAEQFLSEVLLEPEGIVYDRMELNNTGDIILQYNRVLEDVSIFNSQLQMYIESGELTLIEIYWLDPIRNDPPREMEVISAADALMNLIGLLGPSEDPVDITGMELGYFSAEYDAEKWEIPPVWRIQLNDNAYYYINAFTGNIEQDTFMPEQLP
ncbi:MAG: two-component system regulatory protein YycI [Bacillota bacterium]